MLAKTDYEALEKSLRALIRDIPYETANLANASALLWQYLPEINWAGFYKLRGDSLVLGPFQGKPACIVIPMGRGVCGRAAAEEKTQRVDNVHTFPGHIACDGASNAEIVIALYRGTALWGVLDIDSPRFSRFSPEDQQGLERFAAALSEALPEMDG